MKNNKKIALLGLAAVTGFGVVASLTARRSASLAEECAHTHVNHYLPYAPTTEKIGKNSEYWICCGCSTAWADEAKTQVIEAGSIDLATKTTGTTIQKSDVDATDGITTLNSAKVKWTDQNDIENSPKKSTDDRMKWVSVDGRNAAYFSYDYNSSSADDKAAIDLPTSDEKGNAGWTELRFMYTGLTYGVSFEYKYYDLNSDTSSDGGTAVHTMAQAHDTTIDPNKSYTYQDLTFTNDNQWHTATVTFDEARTIDFVTIKIQHFSGELYVSNMCFDSEATRLAKGEAVKTKIAALPTITDLDASYIKKVAAIKEEYDALSETGKSAVTNSSRLEALNNHLTNAYEVAHSIDKLNFMRQEGTVETGLEDSVVGEYARVTFTGELNTTNWGGVYLNNPKDNLLRNVNSYEFYFRTTTPKFLYIQEGLAWEAVNVTTVANTWTKVTLVKDEKSTTNNKLPKILAAAEAGKNIYIHDEQTKSSELRFGPGDTLEIACVYGVVDKTADWGTKVHKFCNTYEANNTNRFPTTGCEQPQMVSSQYGPLFCFKKFESNTCTFVFENCKISPEGITEIRFAYYTEGNFEYEAKTTPNYSFVLATQTATDGWHEVVLKSNDYGFKALTGISSSITQWYLKATSGLTPDSVFAISGIWVK